MKLQILADKQIYGTGHMCYLSQYIAQILDSITLLSCVGCKAYRPVLVLLFQNQVLSCMQFIVFREKIQITISR